MMIRFLYIIALCSITFILPAQTENYLIEPVSELNGSGDDFGPVFPDSTTVYFNSSRRNPKTERVMKEHHNAYFSSYESEQWSFPRRLSYLFNSDNHETITGLSDTDSTIFIYKTFNGGDIFTAKRKENGKWTGVKRAKFNSPYHECSAVTFENTIWFVSDRPGGKGDHDIYRVFINEDGSMTEPENISVLNSEKDENHLFFSEDGKTLYFSSTGFDSYGGFDVFKSEYNGTNWSEPVNLGDFINTENNEITYALNVEGKVFFASDRPSDNAGYNIFTATEQMVKRFVKVELDGDAPIVENETGKMEQLVDSVEVEGYSKDIPEKILVDVTEVIDSTKVIYVADLITDENIKVLDNGEDPIIGIEMIYKKRIEDLTLEEVEEQVDFEPRFYKVQVGAFSKIDNVIDFNRKFPMLGDKVIMISSNQHHRFLLRETWDNIEEAAEMQKKCLFEYNSVKDTFIGVYDGKGKRIIIYFDTEKETYILLRPDQQSIDDIF